LRQSARPNLDALVYRQPSVPCQCVWLSGSVGDSNGKAPQATGSPPRYMASLLGSRRHCPPAKHWRALARWPPGDLGHCLTWFGLRCA